MKKLFIIAALFTFLICLSGCSCKHEWTEATCTQPKTCSVCSQSEGEPIEHDWLEATYITAKTCNVCKKTEGEPLESPYKECDTWESVLQSVFKDEFIYEETSVYTGAPNKSITLTFNDVSEIESFMENVYRAVEVIGSENIFAVSVTDKQNPTKLTISIDKAEIVATNLGDFDLGVSTSLNINEVNEVTTEIKKIYYKDFEKLDMLYVISNNFKNNN